MCPLIHLFINEFQNLYEARHKLGQPDNQIDSWTLVVIPFNGFDSNEHDEQLNNTTSVLKRKLKKLHFNVTEDNELPSEYKKHLSIPFTELQESNAICISFSLKIMQK